MEEVYLNMYDYVIITPIPAFYKVNLYNVLSKKFNIIVFFIAAKTNEKRANDFTILSDVGFSYHILSDKTLQEREVSSNIIKLKKKLKNINYKRLLVSGWDLLEFWYLVMFYPKSKNCLALESSIVESSTNTIKAFVKKIFLSQISTVLASGQMHQKLLKSLKFEGNVKITKGVGIINTPNFTPIKKKYEKKFLYVGRLSKEKNLNTIIHLFNNLPDHSLTIIGDGDDRTYLDLISNSNITFKGAIENRKLLDEYKNHDIFILPSTSEPWGLVVEESLYYGLPVLISSSCGSVELIKNGFNGFIFDPLNIEEIKKIILEIDDTAYYKLIKGVSESSIIEKDLIQVEAYS